MSGQINKAETDAPKAKKGGKGLLVAVVLAVIAGGAGYYATSSGLIALPGSAVGEAAGGNSDSGYGGAGDAGAGEAASFVPLQSLVISLGPQARAKHLQFTAQLEVVPEFHAEITALEPRFLDVLNTYLRAVDERELATPSALVRLRAQMLRRIQIVAGNGKVKDLLVTEFFLN